MSIRIKVILPYLLLTLIVAVTGAYVVTRLVTDSLNERLKNQLVQAGRVVSDDFAQQEIRHIENARLVIYTRGVAEALRDSDHSLLGEIILPTAAGIEIENLFVYNLQGQEMLHLLGQSDGSLLEVTKPTRENPLDFIQPLLASNNPDAPPVRAIRKDPENNRWYYFTAIPFIENEQVIGTAVVGTSLETIMPVLRNTSFANVVIYGEDGHAIASTIKTEDEEGPVYPRTLSIPESVYRELAESEELVLGQNITVEGRSYSIARGRLQVSNDILGVFAVILSSDYVVETSAINRNLYVLIFSIATVVVVLLGFIIARRIIDPLSSLVQTSQAIAGGDLTRRTGIESNDEIGALASTFDEMTSRLEQRTEELERTNKMLEQMDRTKVSFIHISAHELRTPLTLIQGYTYMLQQMAKKDADLEAIANGLNDGFSRMEEVVNSMLDVSKIDSKTLEVSPGDSKISFIISKAKKPFEPAIKERHLDLSIEGLEQLPTIKADTELLHKVFYHLIMNSIKYTPDGGKIDIRGKTIETGTYAPGIEVSVQDTGIGIAPENLEVVFEKFYQTGEVLMHSSGKTKFKGGGPGLGLAIAKGIVEAHGGKIWLESPGYDEKKLPGTTVYVNLPLNGHKK